MPTIIMFFFFVLFFLSNANFDLTCPVNVVTDQAQIATDFFSTEHFGKVSIDQHTRNAPKFLFAKIRYGRQICKMLGIG